MKQESEHAVTRLICQSLGLDPDQVTLKPLDDRLRIDVPAGSYAFAHITEHLQPRLGATYYASKDSDFIELFEPEQHAEAAGRPPLSGAAILESVAAHLEAEETRLIQELQDILPRASTAFHTRLDALMQQRTPIGPQRFLTNSSSDHTPAAYR